MNKVLNISDFIKNDVLVCNFYNELGAIYLKEGTQVVNFKRNIVFYVTKEDFKKYNTVTDREILANYQEKIEDELKEYLLSFVKNEETKTILDKFMKEVSEETIKTYRKNIKVISELFENDYNELLLHSDAKQVINDTYDVDRMELGTCMRILSSDDLYTMNHSLSVCVLFIEAMHDFKASLQDEDYYTYFKNRTNIINFTKEDIKKYAIGALLHDIGKKSVPSDYIHKRERLTKEEFEVVKKHPFYGLKILEKAGLSDKRILSIVGNHHPEYKFFNTEYPEVLTEICNILDVYDACRSPRSYKQPFDYKTTYQILLREKIKHSWSDYIFNKIMNVTIKKFESKLERITVCG